MLYVDKTSRSKAIKIFRTQSPRHFEGGDWNEGGSCRRTEPLLPEQVNFILTYVIHERVGWTNK